MVIALPEPVIKKSKRTKVQPETAAA
jgi:hypothetical protein